MSNIHNFDLNLLRVFDALMEERSVTKAGARLNVTQSAISHALGKMRASIGDMLFISGPKGMHPTPRALELAQLFAPALRQVDMALLAPRFDAQTMETEFAISTSDYATSTLFPRLLNQLQTEAPAVRIWLRPNSDVNIVEELDRGTLHLAMGAFGRIPQRFEKSTLTTEPFVWIMRGGHPAGREPMTVATLAACRHLDILISRRESATTSDMVNQDGLERAYITSNPAYLDGLLATRGLSRRIGATVSHFLAVPPLLAETDMIAFVPLSVAEAARRSHGLIYQMPPYVAAPVTISMLTHRTIGAHPSIIWLRRKLLTLVAGENATE
jgi:DNA-binding transcriptional LysR family regulator